MRIAVNTSILLSDQQEGYGNFLHHVLGRITKNYPGHDFIFIFNKQPDKDLAWPGNVKVVVAKSKANGPLSWKFWYDVRIPALLKRCGADIFIAPDGICSLATRVPQCLLLHDLSFLQRSSAMKRSSGVYLKYYTPKFIRKAGFIATFTESSRALLLRTYKINANKTGLILPAPAENLEMLSEQDKQTIKNKYTDGKEFFLFAGLIHPQNNLLPMLKAYSIFKKRQLSNLKLIIAGKISKSGASFKKSLMTYHYRRDVILLENIRGDELMRIISSAYALIDLSEIDKNEPQMLNSMVLGTPVITHEGFLIRENDKEAVMLTDPHDQTTIAGKMMSLYKDERLRAALIEKASQVAGEYHLEKTVQKFWDLIQKTAGASGA